MAIHTRNDGYAPNETVQPLVERQKTARAHTCTHASAQLLCSMNRVTFLSQMLSTARKKKRRTVSWLSSFVCPSARRAFLKVPISHKFAIIHSSDAISVFCRLTFHCTARSPSLCARLIWALYRFIFCSLATVIIVILLCGARP